MISNNNNNNNSNNNNNDDDDDDDDDEVAKTSFRRGSAALTRLNPVHTKNCTKNLTFKIFSVNVTKLKFAVALVIQTEEILNIKHHFLCSEEAMKFLSELTIVFKIALGRI